MSTRSSLEKAFSQNTRKKKNVGEGKNFKREGKASGGSASNDSFVNFGGGAKQAAVSHEKEQDRKYMQRMVKEQKEIMRDPEKIKEQNKTNKVALQNIFNEFVKANSGHTAVDVSSIMDFAQDYIPTDNKLGQAVRKAKNKSVARKMINKNK